MTWTQARAQAQHHGHQLVAAERTADGERVVRCAACGGVIVARNARAARLSWSMTYRCLALEAYRVPA